MRACDRWGSSWLPGSVRGRRAAPRTGGVRAARLAGGLLLVVLLLAVDLHPGDPLLERQLVRELLDLGRGHADLDLLEGLLDRLLVGVLLVRLVLAVGRVPAVEAVGLRLVPLVDEGVVAHDDLVAEV